MGAQFEGVTRSSQEVYPPLVIRGQRPLRGFTYCLPLASAQVKSAILLAGLSAERPVTIVEPVATRDHTERLLKRLGVSMRCTDRTITLEPPLGEIAAPDQLVIPGDLSSAAFFVVAAAILPDSHVVVREVSLNPSRRHFLDVLTRMGAAIRWEVEDDGWEPRGTLTVTYKPLHGTTVAASEVPLLIDELPILMVAACAAEGQGRFEGLGELRVKETDRLRAMVMGLKRLGAQIELRGDAGAVITHSRLQGTSVDSVQDHRTAMSLAIAGLVAAGLTQIRGAECVAKSLGNFFDLLRLVTAPSVVKTGVNSK
jgi:3-phosphoshikimate 1-carboxyvinyltransferase